MNSRRRAGIGTWLVLGLGLSACAHFENHGPAYAAAQSRAALAVPPDLQTPLNDERLPAAPPGPTAGSVVSAPGATGAAPGLSGGAAPAGLAVLTHSGDVRLVRAGGQRWLRVRAAPDAVWPLAQAFFRARGFQIASQDAAAGMFATDWRKHPVRLESGTTEHYVGQLFPSLFQAGREQRYRVRLEADRAAGVTEVYVAREAVREVIIPDSVTGGATHNWQLEAPNPARDAEALSELMAYLAQQQLPPATTAAPAAAGALSVPAGAESPASGAAPPVVPPAAPTGSSGPAGPAGPAGGAMAPLSQASPPEPGNPGLVAAAPVLAANQMLVPGSYAWQRLGVALAESGAVIRHIDIDGDRRVYNVQFSQTPTAGRPLKALLASRRRHAVQAEVALAGPTVTVTPAPLAVALLESLRGQLR